MTCRAGPFLHHDAVAHESHAVGDVAGEGHLVGDQHRGHAGPREVADDGQHLADEFAGSSAEVASSKSMTSGSMASARAMATRCFCPPDRLAG